MIVVEAGHIHAAFMRTVNFLGEKCGDENFIYF
jgi:hypothetical protein